ncbi:hypothetical protein MTR67_040159 [Solanum verrucosum]|uniref:Gag-pol polyprotein n=1 Tax=Solanum verrucosum TaxID=315347 RepID=A0AAF0ZRV6_SOLVR|nr:hypothetical protein MTR67_040159 [Solanum verrucosum]
MVVDTKARISKFVSGVSNLVVKECQTAMLIMEMDISCLMIHAQQIEEENLKESSRESKRATTSDGDYSHSRSDGHVHPQLRKKFSTLHDPGAMLSFFTPYVAMGFDVGPEILSCPFHVSTPAGDSIVAKRVYRNCRISVSHGVTHVDLVELDMLDFYIILGMD